MVLMFVVFPMGKKRWFDNAARLAASYRGCRHGLQQGIICFVISIQPVVVHKKRWGAIYAAAQTRFKIRLYPRKRGFTLPVISKFLFVQTQRTGKIKEPAIRQFLL